MGPDDGAPAGARGLRLASTLSWCWGGLLALSAIALAVPSISRGGPVALPLLLILLGVSFCVAGHGVRRQQRSAGWVALAASALTGIMLVLARVPISLPGLVVCATVSALVLKNWRALGPRA